MKQTRNASWLETGETKNLNPAKRPVSVGTKFHAEDMRQRVQWEVIRIRWRGEIEARVVGGTVTRIFTLDEIWRQIMADAFEGRNDEETGAIVALSFGADAAAEHEMGIGPLRGAFGLDASKIGLDRRRIRHVPESFVWVVGPNFEGFCYPAPPVTPTTPIRFSGDLWIAWDEEAFAAYARTSAEKERLRDLFDAIKAGEGAMWTGVVGPFLGQGLVLGVATRLPSEVTDQWAKADDEHRRLHADALASGVEVRLRAAGKSWFALTPRRLEEGGLAFWLNPMDHSKNEMGLYSVADLDAWARGEGPVIKKAAPASSQARSRKKHRA